MSKTLFKGFVRPGRMAQVFVAGYTITIANHSPRMQNIIEIKLKRRYTRRKPRGTI